MRRVCPSSPFYGDGGDIENSVLQTIRATYEKHRVAVPWERGDLLMLDNMLVAHGRQPFKGPRKVAMSDPVAWADVHFD